MKKVLVSVLALIAIAAVGASIPATAAADSPAAVAGKGKKKNKKTFTVCERGCKYPTISKAVKKVKKKNSTIKVEPGTYKEGVVFSGHKYDGLTIKGTSDKASKVVLDGKNAKTPDGSLAQNGVEGIDVKGVTLQNMTAKNYATNGFFLWDSDAGSGAKIDCADYLMKNLVAKDNRSYGLYAFGCAGGKITKSMGEGHGDSAFYIGATPIQSDPKRTILTKLDGHRNVLGYSGTNSHYVTIENSDFYNNGIGIVPNTLDSEPFEPASDGLIQNNDIFWNNFNYFLPNSGVEGIGNGGLGEINGQPINYPTGVGIALFGATGWTVQNNNIFGHFKWGSALFSDPFNEDDDAISTDNQFVNNLNGRGGADKNAVDFFNDGSGSGNCFQSNVSSTFDPSSEEPDSWLYPSCPAPTDSGTGTSIGLTDQQILELLAYASTNPAEDQECSWTQHPHPMFEDYKPIDVTPGPTCP